MTSSGGGGGEIPRLARVSHKVLLFSMATAVSKETMQEHVDSTRLTQLRLWRDQMQLARQAQC